MQTEIEILERFIDSNFRSKAAFAKALDMTPQNLNHHIREAKKNQNKFSIDFKLKLQFKGITAFPSLGNNQNDQIIKELQIKVQELTERISELKSALKDKDRLIDSLELQIRAPVVKVRKTGG